MADAQPGTSRSPRRISFLPDELDELEFMVRQAIDTFEHDDEPEVLAALRRAHDKLVYAVERSVR